MADTNGRRKWRERVDGESERLGVLERERVEIERECVYFTLKKVRESKLAWTVKREGKVEWEVNSH